MRGMYFDGAESDCDALQAMLASMARHTESLAAFNSIPLERMRAQVTECDLSGNQLGVLGFRALAVALTQE